MPVIEYDVYKQKLAALGPQLEELAAALDLDGARREVEELEEKSSDANFWNDLAASQKVLQRTKHLKNKLESTSRTRLSRGDGRRSIQPFASRRFNSSPAEAGRMCRRSASSRWLTVPAPSKMARQ